jgi:hypothetical protein
VHEAARWDYDPSLRFWEGEVEPCINGRVVLIGSIVESKRDATGRWPLETTYHKHWQVDLDETVGAPSRWITLHALRILRWAGRTEDAGGTTT